MQHEIRGGEVTHPMTFNSLNATNSTYHVFFQSCLVNSPYSVNEQVLYAFCGAALCILMTITNLLIFIIFVKDTLVARAPGHTIIVGMMVMSDILIGVIPLPGYIVYTLCGGWPLPKFACDLWITMDYLATNVSYLSITTVAFERFVAVFFVLRHKIWMTRKKQIKLVIGLWLFTAGRILLQFPLWANITDFRDSEPYGSCDHPLYHNVAAGLIQRSIALYIPVILMFMFYAAIIYKLCRTTAMKSRDKLIKQNPDVKNAIANGAYDEASRTLTPTNKNGSISSPAVFPGVKSSAVALNKSTNVSYAKSFRMVSLVIMAFLTANLPWHVVENLRVTNQINIKTSDSTYIATWILTYMNGLLNPPLYFFMNRYYRKAATRFIKCQSVRKEAWREHQRRCHTYELELQRSSSTPRSRQQAKTLLDEQSNDNDSDELVQVTIVAGASQTADSRQ